MDLGGSVMNAAPADNLFTKLSHISELSVRGCWLPSIYHLLLTFAQKFERPGS